LITLWKSARATNAVSQLAHSGVQTAQIVTLEVPAHDPGNLV